MKFLYLSFYMPMLLKDNPEIAGGAAIQWKSWIRGFIDNGHYFGLLTWEGAEKYINKKLDFDIIECYNPDLGIKKLRLIYYQMPKLYHAIKKYNPDYLIQGAATIHTFLLMLIAKILRIPFIHRIAGDSDVDENIGQMLPKKEILLYKLGVRYADIIFTQNSYQLNKLKNKFPKKNIYILHNPFELETTQKQILPRSKESYIAWIGNFRAVKNLPQLAKIAHKLPEVEFKIAGIEHKNMDNSTRISLIELKNIKNVEFVGYVKRSSISKFLSKAIGLLNTSFHEGFSNTFLEAWSLGVPVITTKNVNPDEIVSNFNLGKVAEDYTQLLSYLKMIIDLDENEYNELALHCYEYVKENHDPRILAEKFVFYLKFSLCKKILNYIIISYNLLNYRIFIYFIIIIHIYDRFFFTNIFLHSLYLFYLISYQQNQ